MLRGSGTPSTQTQRHIITVRSRLLVQQSEFPFPKIDCSTGIEKRLPRPELEIPQRFRPRHPAKTVELLTVDAKDETEPVPVENGAEDLVEIREIQVVGMVTTRITMGLTLRRTARSISRLKGIRVVIPSA